MYSKPWAWFWTIFIGLASGAVAFLSAWEAGVNVGWAIFAGTGALILVGGGCAWSIVARQPGEHSGSPEDRAG